MYQKCKSINYLEKRGGESECELNSKEFGDEGVSLVDLLGAVYIETPKYQTKVRCFTQQPFKYLNASNVFAIM